MKRLATRIDFALEMLVKSRQYAGLHTPWEALRHCWALTNLALRDAQAVTLMAKTDVVLAPPAWVSARACMEAAARTIWLLEGSDVWDREGRWLALMDEGARTHQRLSAGLREGAVAGGNLNDFIRDLKAKLPKGVRIPGIPSVAEMLEGSGGDLGLLYTLASQYTHGTDYAVLLYRRGLGIDASYGEEKSERSWSLPLWTSWKAVETAILKLMTASDVPLNFNLALMESAVQESFDVFQGSFERPQVEEQWWPSDREWSRLHSD